MRLKKKKKNEKKHKKTCFFKINVVPLYNFQKQEYIYKQTKQNKQKKRYENNNDISNAISTERREASRENWVCHVGRLDDNISRQ